MHWKPSSPRSPTRSSRSKRVELADLIRKLLETPVANRPEWFELSARACELQSQAGVGLVHGIAHSLEGPLRETPQAVGHAALCSAWLLPVFRLNRSLSLKIDETLIGAGLDPQKIEIRLGEVFDRETYAKTIPAVRDNWKRILRDPCTRTNCALVRPAHLEQLLKGVAT